MKKYWKTVFKTIFVTAIASVVIGCSTTNEKSMSGTANEHSMSHNMNGDAKAPSASQMEIYEVYHDGRINVFYDRELYQGFLDVGETPFRLTRIGAGPNGETLVFGLTSHDKKHPDKVDVINLYDGKIQPPANVYAEARRHGRIYVFNNFEDMKSVREFGHPNLFYTEIGAGPKGETVVFVLNEHNKKHRPDALIAEYKAMNK